MCSVEAIGTLVQCDFDGTITDEDGAFLLLDAFADGDWRQLLKEYRDGKMSVGRFNTRAFAMVKADRETLVRFAKRNTKIRPGFHELLDLCRRKGFRFVVVSNGLDFYIETILRDVGVEGVEVFAAQTRFDSQGIEVKYVGPAGGEVEDGLKEAYARLFLGRGYRIIYVGNGPSDFEPAKLAHRVFARDGLLACCEEMNLAHMPFVDLNDVARALESFRTFP